MTRLEKLNGEKRDVIAALEDLRTKIDECKEEAKLTELNEQLEKAWADNKRIDTSIEQEQRLEDEKRNMAARAQAVADQSPGKSNRDNNYKAHDRDLTPDEVQERNELLQRYANDEKLTDDELIRAKRLTNADKAFWRDMKKPKMSPEELALMAARIVANSADDQQRALATTASTTAADGGNTIPEGFIADVVRSMKAFGPFHDTSIVRVLVTSSGNPIDWPTVNDTGNKARMLAEGADAEDKKIAWGDFTLNAYKYTTDMFPVTNEILQDSGLMFESLLRDMMGERFGRKLAEDFTNADGNSKPEGVVAKIKGTAARVVNVGTAVSVDFDDMRNLITKIDPAYRMRGRFMFNSGTEAGLLKVKDTEGRFMWQPDVAAGTRGRIWGYPYSINQDMDDYTVANKDPVIFGDFMKFVCRRVRAMTIRRLDEIAARSDQVAFVGFGRFDSRVLDTAAFSVLHTDTA